MSDVLTGHRTGQSKRPCSRATSGQAPSEVFAITVMAIAASEFVVGLGLIVAMSRRKLPLDVDRLTTLRG